MDRKCVVRLADVAFAFPDGAWFGAVEAEPARRVEPPGRGIVLEHGKHQGLDSGGLRVADQLTQQRRADAMPAGAGLHVRAAHLGDVPARLALEANETQEADELF